MSRGITRNKINSKGSRSSGGGGGTGNMSTTVYDPAGISEQLIGVAIPLTLAAAKSKSDWIDGQLYLITNPISPLVAFYAYGTIEYVIPGLVENPILNPVGYGIFNSSILGTPPSEVYYNINGTAGGELKYVNCKVQNVYVSNSSSTSTDQIKEQLRISGVNCKWFECTLTNTAGFAATSCNNIDASNLTLSTSNIVNINTINNYSGNNDTITFTKDAQFINGINFGHSRTISFNGSTSSGYTDCIIGNGKSCTILSSQTNATFIDGLSTFKETLDTDGLVDINKGLDFSSVQHAGIVKLTSGTSTSANVFGIKNTGSEVKNIRIIVDSAVVNPTFEANAATAPSKSILGGSIFGGWFPYTISLPEGFIDLSYSPEADAYVVTSMYL